MGTSDPMAEDSGEVVPTDDYQKYLRRANFFFLCILKCLEVFRWHDQAACHHYYFNFYQVLKEWNAERGWLLHGSSSRISSAWELKKLPRDYGRKNLSEDGHCLPDTTCALCDASWEGAVDSTVCSACVLSMPFTQGIGQCLEIFSRTGYWHILDLGSGFLDIQWCDHWNIKGLPCLNVHSAKVEILVPWTAWLVALVLNTVKVEIL